MIDRLVQGILVAGIATMATAAGAAPMCGNAAALHEALRSAEINEDIVGAGLAAKTGDQEGYIEVFASPYGLTWTILEVRGDTACIIASGDNWVQIPFVPPAKAPGVRS